ncbi:protein TASOR 2 isoform X2 [Phaenicophaeus curvirostris]|uniref:protein TASOR 2 isoform X2 n=1 Tax=Phaenicophaeus curvirostris TaxID=33595 RepID=UPI0037F0A187
MGERSQRGSQLELEESSCLLQTAVSVLQRSYLDSASQDSFQYSQAVLVENDVFLSELKAFAQAKEAAGYSQEELEETFAFLLFDNEEEVKEVCQAGLRVNSSSISMLGDPAKGVYISKYADCLHLRPWYHGKSGYIVICKLIKGKVKVVSGNYTTSYTCPSPGYDCHVMVSGDNVPSKTSHCQAFEESQYYVYEVSDGSAVERPRQICPYIVIACQYKERKEMPVLAIENLPELDDQALYCPWRGQLSIRGQLLCNIALRTPYSSSIPAQLPPNLDINHVMGLSDLKKKLPEAAFGKRNYIENEVCFQGIYFSLYEVEISKKDQYKMDQLVENLKEKDLAIIKYLQDQGVLILLTSSALARDDGFDPKEPVSLLALFLFTSSRSVCLGATEKHDPKAGREDGDISLKIASVLPGLRYALQKATSSSWDDASSTSNRIKQHFQEYTKLGQHPQPISDQTNQDPLSALLSPIEDKGPNPTQKCSEQTFSQLQRYLSDPSSYTLEVSSALACLTLQSLCCDSEADEKVETSPAVPPDPFPPNAAAEIEVKSENQESTMRPDRSEEEEPTQDVNATNKLWVQPSRRKSSQVVVTSTKRKWSPLKMQMHPLGDGGRNRKATKKKKINITFSFPKRPTLAASSNEPMLKLAHLQFPHRRKRGAEVLSAEFVHRTQSEPVKKETSAPNDPGVETKRLKTPEDPEMEKVPVTETVPKPAKSKMLRSVANSPSKPQPIKQTESEWKEPSSVLPSEVSSQHHGAESQTSEIYPVGVADLGSDLKGIDYESHALNLLADLALGSCIPSFLPRDSGMIPVSCSSSRDSAKEQQQSHHKNKHSRVASDHEYHKVDKLAKGATSPSKATPDQKLPPAEKPDSNDLAAVPRETSPGIFSRKNTLSPSPSKPHVLPPRETQEATEVNKHSFISAEHSYASQLPEHSKRHTYPRGAPYPGPAASRNGTRNAQAGPLVGKVLPFCRQQNSPHHQRLLEAVATRRRRSLLHPRLKEDFAKSHTVNVTDKSVKVTCHWDAEYLFNLDSRYTKDALEKTVIRALHGPWDPDLPDDVEEMKLILHMWVALFYSKPSKLLSSTRKVVEHSNPEKYVSINSSGDILELSDDGEDCFRLETCPADSRSDPDQIPSSSLDRSTCCEGSFHPEESPADSQTDADGSPDLVDSTVSSSSGELPCGEEEPSSTSCPESISLAEGADESLVVKDRWTAVAPEDRVCDVSTITAEKPPKEGQPDATTNSSPFDELGDASKPPAAPGRENPSSQAPNSSRAPWNDALRGRGEQQESGWAAAAGNGPGPPEDKENMRGAGLCTETEDSSQATSEGPRCACDSMLLEAHPKSTKPGGASEEERESQNPEKEEEEVVEIKKEKEDLKYESPGLGAVDLAFSDSDANMEHEHSEQEPANSARPKDFGIPGEDPVPSPAALASPGPDRSTPALPDGTETGPQDLPGEMAPSLDTLQEAVATPNAETSGPGLAHAASPAEVGSPRGRGSTWPLASDPNLICGAQPDSFPGSVGPAGETLGDSLEQKNKEGDGLEQKDKKRAPSAERWVPAGSEAAGTADLTWSPGCSSIHQTSLDGATDPAAPPEDQEAVESIQSPSQSDLPQRCGGNVCADLALLSAGGSNQEEKKVSVEEECGGPSANRTDVLDESWGAGDGQGFTFDCRALAGASDGGESDDMCLSAEKSPKSDKEDTGMVANAAEEPETSLHHLLESEKSPKSDKEDTAMVANTAQEPETSLHHLLESEKSPKGDKEDTGMVANTAQEPETSLHHLLASEKSPKGDKEDTGMVANTAQEPETSLHHLLASEKSPKGDKEDTGMVANAAEEPETSLHHLLASKKSPKSDKEDMVMVANAAEELETSLHHLESEKSPRSDREDTVMVANAAQEPETFLHHLLESEPSSLVSEGMSAMKEHPKQQQSSPKGWSPPACAGSAPSSPPEQHLVPCGRDTDSHHLLERSEQGPISCQHVKPCELVAAEEVRVAAESPGGSLKPRCAEEVEKDTAPCHAEWAESSAVDVLVPEDLGITPPSPRRGHKAGLCSTEPDSGLGGHTEELSPGTSPAPDGSSRSCCMDTTWPRCASPGGQVGDVTRSHEEEPILLEDLESRSSVPLASPASFSPEECLVPLYKPQSWHEAEGSDTFADLGGAGREVREREDPPFPFPMAPFHVHGGFSGESSELSDAEDASAVLPRAEQLPGRDRHVGLTLEDPFESFSGDSDQEYFGRTSQSWGSYSARSMDAADARTTCASSSASSERAEGRSEDWGSLGTERGWTWAERCWPVGLGGPSRGHVPPYVSFRDSQGFTKDYQNLVVTKTYRERMRKSQPSKRRSRCEGRSPLLRSLMGTWRGFEELTQHTLDMEYLRFHYKLKEILRSGKPPFSTSKSIFPKDFSPQGMAEASLVREAPVPLSPWSRSPLQVTILPSDAGQSRFSWREDPCPPWQDTLCGERSRARSRTKSQGRAAPFHLSKLRYDNKLEDSQGDIGGILDEYAEVHRVMLSRVDARSEGGGPVPVCKEATSKRTCASCPGRTGAFEEMITELCNTLRSRLRSLARGACGHAGMFYLVETGKDPFFSRVKTLLRKDGHVEVEPLSFCEVERPDTDTLLVVVRNEDISSHIHHIPCLLKLKHCPNVVFAGVDSPEDITGHTYQELFHAGGFVVSDDELLEAVTLGQLREVVKVLEELNRSARWKWLLHYKESKKLRGDSSRVDANARKKDLILKSCQGADLIEVLHYHACDSGLSSKAEYVRCLLDLQVQRVSARFAVYLTEKPSASREVLESKGILVVDVNTFLGTMQKAAVPFRRSYW